jgi:hypothetical protein
MHRLIAAISISLAIAWPAAGQNFAAKQNYPDRKAVIVNNATPSLTLSEFNFTNEFRDRSTKSITNLKWSNTGEKAISAFEVVILYYDPFNRPMTQGGRWLIPGHDSANWTPLNPGESASDGTVGYTDSDAYTAIAYVRAIRFSDGTVWTSNQSQIEQRIKLELPQLREIGTLDPGPKPVTH